MNILHIRNSYNAGYEKGTGVITRRRGRKVFTAGLLIMTTLILLCEEAHYFDGHVWSCEKKAGHRGDHTCTLRRLREGIGWQLQTVEWKDEKEYFDFTV